MFPPSHQTAVVRGARGTAGTETDLTTTLRLWARRRAYGLLLARDNITGGGVGMSAAETTLKRAVFTVGLPRACEWVPARGFPRPSRNMLARQAHRGGLLPRPWTAYFCSEGGKTRCDDIKSVLVTFLLRLGSTTGRGKTRRHLNSTLSHPNDLLTRTNRGHDLESSVRAEKRQHCRTTPLKGQLRTPVCSLR